MIRHGNTKPVYCFDLELNLIAKYERNGYAKQWQHNGANKKNTPTFGKCQKPSPDNQ
jgi:hypothetical protein